MKTRNINFRETHSERSATRSYKAFGADRAKSEGARLRAKVRQGWKSNEQERSENR